MKLKTSKKGGGRNKGMMPIIICYIEMIQDYESNVISDGFSNTSHLFGDGKRIDNYLKFLFNILSFKCGNKFRVFTLPPQAPSALFFFSDKYLR